MELNLHAQEELKQITVLYAQIKDAERHLVELCNNRQRAQDCGEERHILHRYNDLIESESGKIEALKSMIVEHVHVLIVLTDAQLRTDGSAAAVHAKMED